MVIICLLWKLARLSTLHTVQPVSAAMAEQVRSPLMARGKITFNSPPFILCSLVTDVDITPPLSWKPPLYPLPETLKPTCSEWPSFLSRRILALGHKGWQVPKHCGDSYKQQHHKGFCKHDELGGICVRDDEYMFLPSGVFNEHHLITMKSHRTPISTKHKDKKCLLRQSYQNIKWNWNRQLAMLRNASYHNLHDPMVG